jgi:alpha-1,6-mannosyltransferase
MPAASTRPSSWPRLPLLVACASAPLYAVLLLAGDLKARLPLYLFVHAALFVLYLPAVRWALRAPAGTESGGRWSRGTTLVVSAAILFRLLLLPSTPSLSDDIWRYIWEGGVQWRGFNPYRHAPSDPELSGMRDAVYDRINHKDLPAIYPPLTQGVLALGALAGRSAQGMKALFVAADVGVVLLLLALLRRRGQPPERALVYAWHPLVVVEVAGSGHNDPLAIALLLLATAAIIKDRPWVSMTALALSGLAKVFPWVLVPLYMPRLRRAAVVLPLAAAAGYLPYAAAGSELARSTLVYAESWRSNDFLFGALVSAARASGLEPSLKTWADRHGVDSLYTQPHMLARFAAAALMAAWLGCLWLRRRRGRLSLERAVFLFTAGALLLIPVLHPWYLLWILPWLALFPSPAWLALSGLVPLAYTDAGWVVWAQYLPFFALLAVTGLRPRLRRGDTGDTVVQ